MGGTSQEEQKDSLQPLLEAAVDLFRLLPSVLARGRELTLELQDPQVQWYVDQSQHVLRLWLLLAEWGINPCPHVATHVLEEGDRLRGSSYGRG